MKTTSIGREAAVELVKTKWWEGKDAKTIAKFQLLTDEKCVPFKIFHQSIEKALGRPVYTHEIWMNRDGLIRELLGEVEAPTLYEILSLIPKQKLMVVKT